MKRPNTKEMVWEYYIPEPNSGCWLWEGTSQTDRRHPSATSGYGRIRFQGRSHLAHRLAYEVARGPIPDGMSVCHQCDTPACINPDHLFLGSHAKNMQDSLAKGRNAFMRLTKEQQLAIVADPRSSHVVGPEYGVTHSYVRTLRTRMKRRTRGE